MRNMNKVLILFTLIVPLILSGCSEETEPTEEITDTATIETIEINVRGEVPKQVQVKILGNLPDSCTKIHDINTERTNSSFQIDIITLRTTGVECTEELSDFEERVSLPVNNLPAGKYSVTVEGANSKSGSFEFTEDNVLSASGMQSNATIKDFVIEMVDDNPDTVKVTIIGSLKDPCTELEGTEYELEETTFTIIVKTAREAHTMCNSQAEVPIEEVIELDISGLSAGEYSVESQEISRTFEIP
jgi:PBP1b-binding outer membrane lipoprotein LpoB